MTESAKTYIQYRLSRAHESLAAAHLLASQGFLRDAVSSLYFACFYTVTGLLLSRGLSASRHAGIKNLFNINFIKNNEVSSEYGKLYNKLFEARHRSDYDDFVEIDPRQVQAWLPLVEEFLQVIEALIEKPA